MKPTPSRTASAVSTRRTLRARSPLIVGFHIAAVLSGVANHRNWQLRASVIEAVLTTGSGRSVRADLRKSAHSSRTRGL